MIVEFQEDNTLSVYIDCLSMRVFLDISAYWPVDDHGEPRSVNSIFEEIKGTPFEVGRNTLRLALNGNLDRGYYSNLVKLARLCSTWIGEKVSPNDLLKIEENSK